MAISTTSLDSIRQEARQIALSGNRSRPNPAAELAKELGPSVQQAKQQPDLSSIAGRPEESKTDSVRVTSTIGKAASSGQLSREEAVAIYKEIANLL